MTTIHILQYTIILLLCNVPSIVECMCHEILDPLSIKFFTQIKENQRDADVVKLQILDLHLATQSSSNSLNLREIIRDEIRILLKSEFNASAKHNIEERPSPADGNIEKSLVYLEKNLNHLVSEMKVIKEELKTNTGSLKNVTGKTLMHALCLEEENYIGAFYILCTKILKHNFAEYPKNCKEIKQGGNNVTGIYEIYPRYSKKPFTVLCDMDIKDGGWIHIQKRFDGSQNFFLGWKEYKFGFGNLEGEFWLGLENIHLLTEFEKTELLVEIVDRDNVTAYAYYNSFAIGPESSGYKLERLSGFSGDAGDSLKYHLGMRFSTKDLDFSNDCASYSFGAWWYDYCHHSNLNGKYINIDLPEKFHDKGMHWKSFRGQEYSHSKSRMLIRPSN